MVLGAMVPHTSPLAGWRADEPDPAGQVTSVVQGSPLSLTVLQLEKQPVENINDAGVLSLIRKDGRIKKEEIMEGK